MKKKETIFIISCLLLTVIIVGGIIGRHIMRDNTQNYSELAVNSNYRFPARQFGGFLAAQHAIYVNDFPGAERFSASLKDIQYPIVKNTKMISEFLSGFLPYDAKLLKSEKTMPATLIYDAYLVKNNNWKEFHNRHKTDTVALLAPLRIWSAIANNWRTNTFKYIDTLPTNESWKSFIRGQIYAELGDLDSAVMHFEKVAPEFMNINDYMYLMSFYTHHDMNDRAEKLRQDFTSRPGGMFLANYNDFPDWSVYSGYANALAFSMIQNVSHTHALMYSDMAMVLLRFSQIIAPKFASTNNVIDYYIGQFYFKNVGNWSDSFANINEKSPFYLFAKMRIAEKTGDISHLEYILERAPLFVPAVNKLTGHYIRNGNYRSALRVIDNTLSADGVSEFARAFFTKGRAYIHYSFGDYAAAQKDIDYAKQYLKGDAELMSIQAKVWAAQNIELDSAYNYAMILVRNNPSDILAWDTLGRVVAVREGNNAALEMLVRVGDVSETCSSLYENMGDLYIATGDIEKAKQSYRRAIELSDDGLVVVPNIEKKLRKIK